MADSTIKDLIAELKSGNAGARKQEKTELGKQTSQLAMLKKEIENQGGKAENNEKYNREQLKIQQGELKLSKSNTGYFSKARKQLNEEIKQNKKSLKDTTLLGKIANSFTGNKGAEEEQAKERAANDNKMLSVLGKISGGITGLVKGTADKVGKVAKGGLMALLKGTLFAGLFVLVMDFLSSPAFAKTAKFIGEKVLPPLMAFYNDVIKPTFDAILDFLFNDAFPAIGKFLTETLIPTLKDVYENVIKPAFAAIKEFAVNSLFPALGDIFQKLKDTYTKIKPSLDALFTFLKETTLPVLFETFKKNFELAKDIFMSIIDFVGNIISGDFGAAFGDLKNIGSKIGEVIDNTITGILKSVGLDFEGNISDVIGKFFTGIYDSITETINGIMNSIEGIIRAIPGVGDTVADTLFGEMTPQEIAVRDMKKVEEEKAKIQEEIAADQARIARSESGENEYTGSESMGIKGSNTRITRAQKRLAEQDEELARLADDIAAFKLEEKQSKRTGGSSVPVREMTEEQAMQLDAKAKGGPLGAGRLALVGENGPELIFSKTDAQVKTSQQTDALLNAAANNNNKQSAPIVVNAPSVATNTQKVSNNTSSVNYIGNPDPIFQRASAFAI